MLLVLQTLFGASEANAQRKRGRLATSIAMETPGGGGGGGGTPAALSSEEQTSSSDVFTTNVLVYTTASSIGFAADTLAVMRVVSVDDPAGGGGEDGADVPSSVSQTGVTWTQIATSVNSTGLVRVTAYCAIGDGTAAATITANFDDAQTGAMFFVSEYTGAEISSADCVDSFAQISTTSGSSVGTNLATSGTVTLSAPFGTRTAGSALSGGFAVRSTCTWAGRTGFTLGAERTFASPSIEALLHERMGGTDSEASVVVGPCANNSVSWAGVALEILADTSGGDTTKPVLVVTSPEGIDTTVSTAAGFDFTGTATDNDSVSNVGYTCDNCVVEPAVVGTSAWTVTDVTLGCSEAPGTLNTFLFTATDPSANASITITRRVTCVTSDAVDPQLLIVSPTASSLTVGPGSQTLSGTASDETAMHATEAVTWGCPQCSVVSGTATLVNGQWSAIVTPTCSASPGTSNVVTFTAKDTSNNTTTAQRTYVCVSDDSTPPVATITGVSECSPANGANCTATSLSTVLSGTATDNSALRGTAPVTGSSPGCTPSSWTATPNTTTGASVNWSRTVTCPAEAVVTHTVTAHDSTGNTHADTVQVTYPVAGLSITTAVITRPVQGEAFSFQMACDGGTSGGTCTWSTATDLGFADDADCAGLSMNGSGAISGTPTAAASADVVCTVRFVATAAPDTAEKTLNLNVSNGALEGPDDFYNDMVADPSFHDGWQLRSQAEIEAQTHQSSGAIQTNRYRWPLAAPGDCYESSCVDPAPIPQNAAKLEIPTVACVSDFTPRKLVSVTTGSPSTIRWGDKISATPLNVVQKVTITNASLPELNGVFFIIPRTQFPTPDPDDSASDGEVEGELYTGDYESLTPFVTSTSGAFTGTMSFVKCDCAREPICGGGDDPGKSMRFFANVNIKTSAVMWIWDFWWDENWTGLIKSFYPSFTNSLINAPTEGSIHLEHVGSKGSQSTGNGTGDGSLGVIGTGTFNAGYPTAIGNLDLDPYWPSGEGGSGIGRPENVATNMNFHHRENTWHRFHLLAQVLPWNDDLFDPWRRNTGLTAFDAGFPTTSCTVNGAVTTCVGAQFLRTNKWSNKVFDVTISGNSDPALNNTFTATTVESVVDPTLNLTSFTIPTPPGAVGGTGGVFNPHFMWVSLWVSDENRDATRIFYGIPYWNNRTQYLHLVYGFDTSDKAGVRQVPMNAYTRNIIALEDPPLDLSGVCDNDLPPATGEGSSTDRGWCVVDAVNNPTYFRRPVRNALEESLMACSGGACGINLLNANGPVQTVRFTGLTPATEYLVKPQDTCSVGGDWTGDPKDYTATAEGEVVVPVSLTDDCTVIIDEDVINVTDADNLQTAIDNAQAGDTLLLAEGDTWTGSFSLDAGNTGWVTIRCAGAGANIVGNANTGAIQTDPGAKYWYIKNCDLSNTTATGDIMRLGTSAADQDTLAEVPSHIVVDGNRLAGHATNGQRRGIALHTAYSKIINNEVTDIKAAGTDTQAILGGNGPGPYIIADNLLQATGENILFGGFDPPIVGMVPSDITITRNTISKPLSWETEGWQVKNLIEMKNATDVTITYNDFDGNWASAAGPRGDFAWFKSTDQNVGGTYECTLCEVRNVTFAYNVVTNVAGGFNLHRAAEGNPVPTTDIFIYQNFIDINPSVFVNSFAGDGKFAGVFAGIDGVEFYNNTIIVTAGHSVFMDPDVIGEDNPNFVFRNNIFMESDLGIKGASTAEGTATLTEYFPGGVFGGNLFQTNGGTYPAGFTGVASLVNDADYNTGTRLLDGTSPYKLSGTDGNDPGWNGTGGVP
jgi:hypothetical protein